MNYHQISNLFSNPKSEILLSPEILAHVNRWRAVAPLLEEERRERIRNADTKAFVSMMSHVFAVHRHSLPTRLDSGLVLQQAEFRKTAKPRSI